jgi:phospholipase/carboxylesterase
VSGPAPALNTPLQTLERGAGRGAEGAVVWLHGLGATADDFAPLVPYLDAPHLRFVFPQAPSRAVTINFGAVMPAWYDIKTLSRGPEREEAADIRAAGDQLSALLEAVEEQGIPAERIVLAGFSQGAAMALHVGLRYPRPLAGLLILSGYLVLADTLEAEATAANEGTAIQICHGSRDAIVPISAGRATFELLERGARQARWLDYPMGHEVCDEEVEDIKIWLAQRLPARQSPAHQ